jgi:hypothetical protein
MRILLSLVLLLALSGTAAAQAVSMYAPLAPKYQIGDFEYQGPKVDGWRQVTTGESSFILVYAETVDQDKINTRAQLNAEAFAIPEGLALNHDTMWLTEQGQAQQVKERGDNLVAFSKIAPVESNPAVMTYSLVSKQAGVELYETFYVMLAPNKTSYIVAKVTTKDTDFRTQPYFGQVEASLASLRHAPRPKDSSAPPAPTPPVPGA